MAEIINLDDYRKDCRNCFYHTEQNGLGVCAYPGGWEWDKHFSGCITFRWKNGRPGARKEGVFEKMSYQVSEADLKTIRLNEQDTVSSVLHNVALILATPKGTIPMYRDFGLDREFLDMPIPEAEVRMIAPIREAVEEWEPRATVKDVFFTRSGDGSGRLLAHVEIEINELGNG